MELIIDFMLLAASGAATFYCIVLSRKLERLKSTEGGIGATIATLSQTVDEARSAVSTANGQSKEQIEALEPLIANARELLPKLQETIDVVNELSEIVVADIETAGDRVRKDVQRDARALRQALEDSTTAPAPRRPAPARKPAPGKRTRQAAPAARTPSAAEAPPAERKMTRAEQARERARQRAALEAAAVPEEDEGIDIDSEEIEDEQEAYAIG